ncbi:uncharacterized protein RSE6_00677 [Rhynchosporium secalis]|uniref:Uncharacterized protein n=1 Tax=Rhynchosporium secalis TaxID=38038 RepID=A0A1E1LVW8_RHYSE|nr:uncharacterized protein RSE6_00677 [Rhynchosporium secalis]
MCQDKTGQRSNHDVLDSGIRCRRRKREKKEARAPNGFSASAPRVSPARIHLKPARLRDSNLPLQPVHFCQSTIMSKDSSYTYVHFNRPRDADLFEDFCKDKLPDDDIYVPPHHQPINPEDEDDVVPDQHAAFGIQRATQKTKEAAWKDLGLAELMRKGPGPKGAGGSAIGDVGPRDTGIFKPGSKSLPR